MGTQTKYHKCPKCGEITRHVKRYEDGSSLYIHNQVFKRNPFPHMMIDRACSVSKIVWE